MKSRALDERNALPRPPRLALIALSASLIYGFLWPAVTGDMKHYLVPWLDAILTRGQVGVFAELRSTPDPDADLAV